MRTWQLLRAEVVVCPRCIRTGKNFHKEGRRWSTSGWAHALVPCMFEFLCQPQRWPSATAATGAEPLPPFSWPCPSWELQWLCLMCAPWRELCRNKSTALSVVFILQFIVAWWRWSQTGKGKSAAEGFGEGSAWKPERQLAFLMCIYIWTSDKAWVDRTGFLNPLRLVYRVLWFRLIPECLLR